MMTQAILFKFEESKASTRMILTSFYVFSLMVTGIFCAAVTAGESPDYSSKSVFEDESYDWCEAYKEMGKLYSNQDNPVLQEFKLMGRFQYQYANVDGKGGGTSFDYDTDEVRRFYFGGAAKMFNYLELSGQANIFRDRGPVRGSRGFVFQHMWDLYARLDLNTALGLGALDVFKFGYGKRELNMSEEWNVSSKSIKTVERSAISNKIWPYDLGFSNPTGGWFEFKNDNWSGDIGAFSTSHNDWIANWDDGEMFYMRNKFQFTDRTGADISEVLWTAFYQNAGLGDKSLANGLDWASSLALRYGEGPWTMRIEGIAGDNGDTNAVGGAKAAVRQGTFWGFVFLPSYYLVEDKLEAVFRYQYEGASEAQGVRVYSRYSRRADAVGATNLPFGGRGDKHHSFYTGLNYYLCGDNAKIMAGIQYDDIDSGAVDVYNGWTTFLAFRTFF